MTQHSSYLSGVFENPRAFQETVDRACKQIQHHLDSDQYDFIACRGVSGMVVASPVSLLLDKQLVVVRKDRNNSHALYMVEGLPITPPGIIQKYIVIDDMISTGFTIESIDKEINVQVDAELMGTYLYRYNVWRKGMPFF